MRKCDNCECGIYGLDCNNKLIDGYVDDGILGYDCDGNEIKEFRILRSPFSADIENWNEEPNIDPRFYCLVRYSNGEILAVSVYDDCFRERIRIYEQLDANEGVSMLIRPVSSMENYEVAFDGITGNEWYYDRNKDELRKKLNCILKKQQGLVKSLVKKIK